MTLSRRAFFWIGISSLGLFASLGALLFGAYLYIQSDGFREILSEQLSTISGHTIQLSDQVIVRRLLPSPIVALPNTRLLASESAVRRARVDGLEITLSPAMLFSNGREGAISLSVDRLSVIADAAERGQPDTTGSAVAAPPAGSESMTNPGLLKLFRPQLAAMQTLRVDVAIKSIDLIMRNGGEGSSRYAISDVSLEAFGKRISLEADIHDAKDATHRARLSFNDLGADDSTTPARITGRIDLAVARYGGHAAPWQFTAALVVEPHAVLLPELNLKSPVAWLRGQLVMHRDGNRERLDAELELRQLELAGWSRALPVTGTTPGDRARRVFTSQALGLSLPVRRPKILLRRSMAMYSALSTMPKSTRSIQH